MATATISIADEPTIDVVHRFRNFGEDIHRFLNHLGAVDFNELDRATTTLALRDLRTSDMDQVDQVIRRELKRHNFEASATIIWE